MNLYKKFYENNLLKQQELNRIKNTILKSSEELNQILVSRETSEIISGIKIYDLRKRPQIKYSDFEKFDITRPKINKFILENKILSENINYSDIKNLRLEAIEKLNKIRPANI